MFLRNPILTITTSWFYSSPSLCLALEFDWIDNWIFIKKSLIYFFFHYIFCTTYILLRP
jgi:hypothetical protein